ncbi:MAG: DoxX family protein [Puniceicoccaceae bacterium]|nr:hypothetical protein [Puniceicoccaceae bacterium]RCL36388.1 MAG: DoxX family protein [Puniceicoccaceae bacterium]|tara:strand:+ start:2957 stop:3325 length:369 start_codon:yes stop_codon:yes gene_type:complete
MIYLQYLLQIVAGLGIFNVWLLRFGQDTEYRGGNASNMREEFVVYGLPTVALYIIGFLKIVSAIGLIAGIFLPLLIAPSAILLAALMIGALVMHFKIKDPFKRSIPALIMLTLCVVILLLAS